MVSRIDVLSVILLIITVYLSVCVYKKSFICRMELVPPLAKKILQRRLKLMRFQHCGCRNMKEVLDIAAQRQGRLHSETHIKNSQYDDNDDLFAIDGYKFIKRNRKDGNGGGVAVYLKDNVEWQRRSDLERDTIENIWLEVIIPKSKSILLGIFYRPPWTSKYLGAEFKRPLMICFRLVQRKAKKLLYSVILMLTI